MRAGDRRQQWHWRSHSADARRCRRARDDRLSRRRGARPQADGFIAGLGHAVLKIDIEDSASTSAAGKAAREAFGRLDILVNSAGFTKPIPHGNLDALDDAFMDKMLIANVRGPFSMIRSCAPLMKEKRTTPSS